jgi:hypothetical protein
MSKRNQRWGKAIDAIRATGKHGATAIDIGNAVLGTHGISARDREAYGLALGTRLVRLKMATVLANNRFVMTRPDTRDEEKTYADELRNQPFTSMVEAKEQAADRRRRQMAQKQQRLQREACTSKSCFDRTSVSSPIELKRVSFKVDPGQSAKKPKTPIATKNGHSGTCSAVRGVRPCPKQSNDRSRSQNGRPSVYRIRGYEAGHQKRYIRATDRHHLWPR